MHKESVCLCVKERKPPLYQSICSIHNQLKRRTNKQYRFNQLNRHNIQFSGSVCAWVCINVQMCDTTSLMNRVIMLSNGICRMSRDTIMNKPWSMDTLAAFKAVTLHLILALQINKHTRFDWYLILATGLKMCDKSRKCIIITIGPSTDRSNDWPTDGLTKQRIQFQSIKLCCIERTGH